MNILFHHRTRGKGAEGVHIRGVVKGLRQLGHQVSILSLPGAEPEAEEQHQKTAQQDSGPEKKPAGRSLASRLTEATKYVPEFVFELIEIMFNLVSLLRIRKAVRTHSSTMIYERYSLFLFSTVWWARRHNIPVVLEINDSCLVHRVRPLFFKGIARRFERWIFQNATGLVFISTHFKQTSEDAYGTIAPSVVSPNGADLDAFQPDTKRRTQLRKELGIDDKLVLGYVGAFVHWHGIDWFVDEIAGQLGDYPNVVLLLVGDGVCFEPIKEAVARNNIQSQVLLPGRVPHEQIATYIDAMDYGILPDSNDYGSPMKLFEFMAMAKGMVVPDFSPVAEVVEDNKTSWLFPANDREQCIKTTLELTQRPDVLKTVGENARRYIETQRQWRHNAEQLMSLVTTNHA
ncbi:glycosyltransferase family 4 protein [Alteromonas halophila]|uniref:Glycosyl transferase family 1 n=1 Tax=Alteromonas halophila TaxID=516698 RepID=A0A918MZF3_9ALTE|nr:glycosyltransferase family 4 protein [Alteromonas halophila]GGW87023.1 glycosyl transferase family 1 [Alteromonas halophila]